MIFDVHIHVQPWEMLKSEVRSMLEKTADPRVIDILAAPKNLLQWMDAEGIDRACLINYVSPDVMGFGRASIDWIAEFTAGHRDRLLPVGSVHPQVTPDVAAETNRILDLGIRLVKVHPPHQVIAANAYRHGLEKQAELYRICQERGVPVMFHTGTSIFPRARNVYADPMPIDDVAIDFPRLKIILPTPGGRSTAKRRTFSRGDTPTSFSRSRESRRERFSNTSRSFPRSRTKSCGEPTGPPPASARPGPMWKHSGLSASVKKSSGRSFGRTPQRFSANKEAAPRRGAASCD